MHKTNMWIKRKHTGKYKKSI